MVEKLHPNEHQQEDRATQAKALAEIIERKIGGSGAKVTLKGEAIEVGSSGKETVITANGDDTFSIKDGASHVSADDVLRHLA